MSKTLLHRLFGFGKIPKQYAPTLHDEGIVLIDEGIVRHLTRGRLAPSKSVSRRPRRACAPNASQRRPPNNVLEPASQSRLEFESRNTEQVLVRVRRFQKND